MAVIRGDEIEGILRTLGLPRYAGRAREEAIVDVVRRKEHDRIEWSDVPLRCQGHTGTARVMSDALKLKGIRLTAAAETAQRVADALGCVMLTTRIADALWAQADVRVAPCIGAPKNEESMTKWMVIHSRQIDARVRGRVGLVANVGKHWVITPRFVELPGRAACYGWFDREAPNGVLWQPLELKHTPMYQDYSFTVRLVRRDCVVDGVERDLREVLCAEGVSKLVSNEGPFKTSRLPGVRGDAGGLVGERWAA